jgi:hypothetical protein
MTQRPKLGRQRRPGLTRAHDHDAHALPLWYPRR